MLKGKIERWRHVVFDAIEAVSNLDLQKRAWFGVGTEQSSPDEMINQLLGDAALEDFLRLESNDMSEEQIRVGWELLRETNLFVDGTPDFLKPADVINDLRWVNIRMLATAFLRSD